MMVAMLHLNGQLRTEDGYTQGCQKPAVLHRTTELMSTMS